MSTHPSKKIIESLHSIHAEIKSGVESRLSAFSKIWQYEDDKKIFTELVFCLLTPQSGSRRCWQAVENMLSKKVLFEGNSEDICRELNIVRFKNNKTSYILAARERFVDSGASIRKQISGCGTIQQMRGWLAENVKGIGLKEASHFLRNIGLGSELAILDRHVLRNMVSFGLIPAMPQSLSPRRYFEFEGVLRGFSSTIGIPMGHLDFILLYKDTGDFFK